MWFYFQGLYFGYLFFCCWNSFHLLLFLSYMWVFLFLATSFEISWFICLYLLFLNYFFFEVLWFFSLYFLLLSYFVKPYFNVLILVRCLRTCWIAINKIWKMLLINFQLILHNFFIYFMLS
jgi:hypothetical protein